MKGLRLLSMKAGDVSAQAGKFLDDVFVAAINMVNAIDDGLAGSEESGEDEAGAGAKIGSLDNGAGERRGAADDGAAAIDRDVRTHAHHFTGVEEAVFENSFGNDGSAVGLRGKRHVLCLHVGGEGGILPGGHIGGDEFVAIVDADGGAVDDLDRDSGRLKFGDNRVEV